MHTIRHTLPEILDLGPNATSAKSDTIPYPPETRNHSYHGGVGMGRPIEMKSSFLRAAGRFAAIAGIITAFTSLASPQTPKAPAPPQKCLMWKAVSGTNVVYLLGSIHLGSKKMYPLPKPIEDAYSRSKVLVVEVDITKVDTAEAMSFVSEKGMYQGGDTLWKHLSPETTGKVKAFGAKYGMDDSVLGMLKPWLVSVELEVLPMQKAGMDLKLGIDKYFLDRASSPKTPKTVVQLETADFQLKLLSSLPENLSDEYLSYSLGESSNSLEEDSKLEKLWIAGDAKALNDAMPKYPEHLVSLMRSIREDRNPHMADVAEKYLKGGGPCFFVVGAAHLVGSEGVIALLQQRGYTVFQVSSNP